MKKEELLGFYMKYRIFIFPVAVICSSIILIVLVIYPQISKLLANRTEYAEVLKKSQFLEVKAQELSSIDDNEVKRKLNIALMALPPEKDYAEVIGLMQVLVGKYGFILDSIRVGTNSTEKTGGGEGFTIDLEIQGPKSNLKSLLNTLEDTSRVIKMQKIDVSAGGVASGVNKINLVLNIYYAALPSNLGSSDLPVPKLTDEENTLINNIEINRNSIYTGTTDQQDSTPVPKGKLNPFE